MVMKNKQLSKKSGTKIPTGGSSTMMHRQASGPQKPGVTSQEHSGKKSKGPVRGGTTRMAGKTGAGRLKPA